MTKFKRKVMKRLLLMLSITILMSSCATYYLVDTNFYTLQRGMTKQSFINWIESKIQKQRGGRKTRTHCRGGKWSLKYKKSINCNRPKGFSQRQHCKYGRKTLKRKY